MTSSRWQDSASKLLSVFSKKGEFNMRSGVTIMCPSNELLFSWAGYCTLTMVSCSVRIARKNLEYFHVHVSHTGVFILLFSYCKNQDKKERDKLGSASFFAVRIDVCIVHSLTVEIYSLIVRVLIFCRKFSQWKFQPENLRSVCKSDRIFKGMCLDFNHYFISVLEIQRKTVRNEILLWLFTWL